MSVCKLKNTAWLLLFTCSFLACGGAQDKREQDPIELMSHGKCAEALLVVQKRNLMSPEDRALTGLCLIVENRGTASTAQAVKALTGGTNSAGPAQAADAMLKMAFRLPEPIAQDVSISVAEAAIGAVNQGHLGASTTSKSLVDEAQRHIAIGVVERVHLALMGSTTTIDSTRLISIWNGCFALMAGSFEIQYEAQAWRLFYHLSGLAVTVFRALFESDFSKALLSSAISVVEANPSIAIAAKCDLASPYDDLKSVLAYQRELLVRLERSVDPAGNCIRGEYAPQSR